MMSGIENENWDAIGLTGVHCAIAMADAVVIKLSGKRSAGDRHMDTCNLLQQTIPKKEDKAQVERLRRIIEKKNLIEYESKRFTKKEAEALSKHVQRFYEWGEQLLISL